MSGLNMITKVVQQVFHTGYLTSNDEAQIRCMFETGCNLDDIDALMDLQYAVMSGHVRRETYLSEKKPLMQLSKLA